VNRALRTGDRLTFRDGELEKLRRRFPEFGLPEPRAWELGEGTAVIVGYQMIAGRRMLDVQTDKAQIYVWPGRVKLDNRAAHNRLRAKIEAEKVAARKLRAKKRGAK
jgi:hypothetical protein